MRHHGLAKNTCFGPVFENSFRSCGVVEAADDLTSLKKYHFFVAINTAGNWPEVSLNIISDIVLTKV